MSRPQVPEILVGFRERFWVLAILMDTGWNSSRKEAQQKGVPQMPRPPSILASSRTPICRSSMRVWKTPARSFTRARKSTRPSAVKKKRILFPSKLYSTSTSFISSPCCGDLLLADAEGLVLLLPVAGHGLQVLLRGDADQGAEGGHHASRPPPGCCPWRTRRTRCPGRSR